MASKLHFIATSPSGRLQAHYLERLDLIQIDSKADHNALHIHEDVGLSDVHDFLAGTIEHLTADDVCWIVQTASNGLELCEFCKTDVEALDYLTESTIALFRLHRRMYPAAQKEVQA